MTYLLIILTLIFMLYYLTFLFDYLSPSPLTTYHTYLALTYALIGSPRLNNVQLSNLNKDSVACFTTACALPAVGRFSFNVVRRAPHIGDPFSRALQLH